MYYLLTVKNECKIGSMCSIYNYIIVSTDLIVLTISYKKQHSSINACTSIFYFNSQNNIKTQLMIEIN